MAIVRSVTKCNKAEKPKQHKRITHTQQTHGQRRRGGPCPSLAPVLSAEPVVGAATVLQVDAACTYDRHVQQQYGKELQQLLRASQQTRSHWVQHSRRGCLSCQPPRKRGRKVRLFKNTREHVVTLLRSMCEDIKRTT